MFIFYVKELPTPPYLISMEQKATCRWVCITSDELSNSYNTSKSNKITGEWGWPVYVLFGDHPSRLCLTCLCEKVCKISIRLLFYFKKQFTVLGFTQRNWFLARAWCFLKYPLYFCSSFVFPDLEIQSSIKSYTTIMHTSSNKSCTRQRMPRQRTRKEIFVKVF